MPTDLSVPGCMPTSPANNSVLNSMCRTYLSQAHSAHRFGACRFDGEVKIKAITIIGGPGGSSPATVKLCVPLALHGCLAQSDVAFGAAQLVVHTKFPMLASWASTMPASL